MEVLVDEADRMLQDPQRIGALLLLWMMADERGSVALSLPQLAARWNVSRHTVLSLLRELEVGGWIEIQRHPGRMTTYRLTGRGLQTRPVGKTAPPTPLAPSSNLTSPTHGASQATDAPAADSLLPATKLARKSQPKLPGGDASRLLHQHADRFTARFHQPFAVAWARDTQIYKRLVATYGGETVERLQIYYCAQGLDSFAAKRGFSVPQFAAEIAGLAAQDATRQRLDPDQAELVRALQETGMADPTALALVTDYSLEGIRDQLQVHRWRQAQGQPTHPGRLERAIRERWVVPEASRRVGYSRFPGIGIDGPNDPGPVPPTPSVEDDSAVQAALAGLLDKIVVQR